MKNSFRIFSVFFLLAIYCFAVSIASNLPTDSTLTNHQSSEQKQYFASSSANLFYHTEQQAECSINNFERLSFPDFKDYKSSSLIIKASAQLFKTELLPYYNFSKTFLIKYRKTDIIFPFHYFW
jgi:hypothetical protein